jgi:hypothetical protein
MFDTSFEFSFIQRKPTSDPDIPFELIFQFRTNHRRYIVIVEEYRFDIFIVKFYPATKKNDDNRFQVVLNDYEFAPIIRTCINIMLEFLKKNPLASFGYIGANSIIDGFEEAKSLTQRFRIYDYVMGIFLNTENFLRLYSEKNSGALLLNLKNENIDKLIEYAKEMFIRIYPDLES